MGKFVLYTVGFALLACVPAILLAGMFSGGGGDVAPFLLGMLAVGAVFAGGRCVEGQRCVFYPSVAAAEEGGGGFWGGPGF